MALRCNVANRAKFGVRELYKLEKNEDTAALRREREVKYHHLVTDEVCTPCAGAGCKVGSYFRTEKGSQAAFNTLITKLRANQMAATKKQVIQDYLF